MALGLVPALLVLVGILAALVGLLSGAGELAAWLTPFADDWAGGLRSVVRLLLAFALVGGAVVVASLVFTGLTLAVGDPFYERIWAATEEMLGDPPAGDGVGWWRSVLDGLALAGLGLLMGLLVLVLGLLPVVGAAVGLVGGLLVSGRLLAGELLARPLEARGLDRHQRRELLRGRRGPVWGFGLATQAFFLVPLGAVVVMPGAVAGATMLARDLLAEPLAARAAPPATRPVDGEGSRGAGPAS